MLYKYTPGLKYGVGGVPYWPALQAADEAADAAAFTYQPADEAEKPRHDLLLAIARRIGLRP